MERIVKEDQPFIRSEMSPDEALELFADQPYKCEIIQRVTSADGDALDAGEVGSGDVISAYRNSEHSLTCVWVHMCQAPESSNICVAANLWSVLAWFGRSTNVATYLWHRMGIERR